jgi:hypothetical protein
MSDETVQKSGGVVVHGVVPLSCFLIELCLYYPPPGCKTGCKIRASYTQTRGYLPPKEYSIMIMRRAKERERSLTVRKTAIITHSGKNPIRQSNPDRVFLFPGMAIFQDLPASQPYTPGSSARSRHDRPGQHEPASAIDTPPRNNGSAIKQPG